METAWVRMGAGRGTTDESVWGRVPCRRAITSTDNVVERLSSAQCCMHLSPAPNSPPSLPPSLPQLQYSLLDTRPENGSAQYCAANGISLLPYGVLAGGFLSEKYLGMPLSKCVGRGASPRVRGGGGASPRVGGPGGQRRGREVRCSAVQA